MDTNQLLALEFEVAQRLLKDNGYIIEKMIYLNEPPGSLKVVRLKELASNKVEVVVTYYLDPLKIH